MSANTTYRLHLSIAAVCPIIGVGVGVIGNSSTCTITFDPSASAAQQSAAQSALTAFDWSDAADATFSAQQQKTAATTGIDSGQLQTGDKLERMVRAVVLLVLDEINILRAAIPHRIVSITRSGNVATVTTDVAHGFAVADPVAIAGADVAAYNIATTVATVPTATTFTYAVAGTPTTPATGSMSYTLGAVPLTQPRTTTQLVNAVKAKIAATAE